MNRDVFNYSTPTNDNVTEGGMHSLFPVVQHSPQASGTGNKTLKPQSEPSAKRTKISPEEFYSTYNPTIGLHTAAVLGGILVLLIVYLLYRTKCRKCIIRLVQKQMNHKKQIEKDMVIEIEETKCLSFAEPGACPEVGDVICEQCLECDPSDDTHDEYYEYCRLPEIETDMVQATAQWITDQPLESEFGDTSGIILKVNSKMLRRESRGTDQMCFENHPSTTTGKLRNLLKYKLNRSLPILNRYNEVPMPNSQKIRTNQKRKYSAIPLQTVVKKRMSTATSLDTREISGTKQPIDLTPIIRIQNYDSPNFAKCRRCSKDTYSSNSSDEYLLQKRLLNWKEKNDNHSILSQTDHQELSECTEPLNKLQNNIMPHLMKHETKL